ncbi:uncharacterized protein PG986_014435 [Apiospora aurea]|uniref:Uncharacterized protein n=1 Tax=Apiospora aurea TaxID=335848 RepID=A0ABR1PSZ6_9PEZI
MAPTIWHSEVAKNKGSRILGKKAGIPVAEDLMAYSTWQWTRKSVGTPIDRTHWTMITTAKNFPRLETWDRKTVGYCPSTMNDTSLYKLTAMKNEKMVAVMAICSLLSMLLEEGSISAAMRAFSQGD